MLYYVTEFVRKRSTVFVTNNERSYIPDSSLVTTNHISISHMSLFLFCLQEFGSKGWRFPGGSLGSRPSLEVVALDILLSANQRPDFWSSDYSGQFYQTILVCLCFLYMTHFAMLPFHFRGAFVRTFLQDFVCSWLLCGLHTLQNVRLSSKSSARLLLCQHSLTQSTLSLC